MAVCLHSSALSAVVSTRRVPCVRPALAACSTLRRSVGRRTVAAAAGKAATQKDTVVPEPSLRVPLGVLAISGLSFYEGGWWTPFAALTGILGVFLAVQSTRVKFVFGPETLEVVLGAKPDEETENAFVGGANRWAYSTFTNWEMWWPAFPVLVYFRETQTKPEGQIHFFPVLFNGKQVYNAMVERCGPSQHSGPKGQ